MSGFSTAYGTADVGTMPLWGFALHGLKMRCCFLGDMRVHVVVILRTERHNNSTDNGIRLPFGELEVSRIVFECEGTGGMVHGPQ